MGHDQSKQRGKESGDLAAAQEDDSSMEGVSSLESQDKPHLDFLLLGKSGQGKSATGNSILLRKNFKASASLTSCTFDVGVGYADRRDCILKIVDAPGVGDTRLDEEEKVKKAVKDMTRALVEFSEGFHALIVVLKFGQRFTTEEQEAIKLLKSMLGPGVFRKHGVLVMTHGDSFNGAMEEAGTPDITPVQWCEQQTDGNFSELFREFDFRLVLFDNRSKDIQTRHKQVEELLEMVKKLPDNGDRYTSKEFETMKNEHEKLIIQAKLPQMEQKIKEKCSLLEQAIEAIEEDEADVHSKLTNMKIKANDLIRQIDEDDKGTGVLMKLQSHVSKLMVTIEKAEAVHREFVQNKLRSEIKDLKKREAEQKKRAQELQSQIETLKSEFREVKQGYDGEKHNLDYAAKTSSYPEALTTLASIIWPEEGVVSRMATSAWNWLTSN